MAYGVTDNGFVLKRMDTIIEEIHEDLTNGFGYNTRVMRPSFLDTLVTTFAGQIADLWEVAQDNYFAKFVSTATGKNLDNAAQYGGLQRASRKQSTYPLYCTGDDGTTIPSGAVVSTDTLPEIRLDAVSDIAISRSNFNSATIRIAVVEAGKYIITLNGEDYTYQAASDSTEADIIDGLKTALVDSEFDFSDSEGTLTITSTSKTSSNTMSLSENLTTVSVTSIGQFATEDYGKIVIPNGLVTKIVQNVPGFSSVTNQLNASYGRDEETDIEFRQSYLAKSAMRSNSMVDAIADAILEEVSGVESAVGYENPEDTTDSHGLPPHSVELVVEGGDAEEIAAVILEKKIGGISTYGSVQTNVVGENGETILISFNRPSYLYAWLKVVVHGDKSSVPSNYKTLVSGSVVDDIGSLKAGENVLIQTLASGIYADVSGVTYVDVAVAYSADESYTPEASEYKNQNIIISNRQMVKVDASRIEVSFDGDS